MKIDVAIKHTCSGNKMSCQVDRRVQFALSRFGTSILSIKVRITDINGPKGGVDTRCVVSAKLASGGEVIVQDEGEDVFSALNHCLSRAGRTINRILEQRRDNPIRMNRRRTTVEDERNEYSPYCGTHHGT